MATKVKVPQFDSVNKTYSRYVQEIEFWKVVSKVDKKEQGVILAYELPESDPSGMRDKLFHELPLDQLNCDDGVDNFISYMDNIFKKDDQTQAYEDCVQFDSYRRGKGVKIQDFFMEFDKLYNIAAKRDMRLPNTVLAFKLLDAAQLSKNDRMFVLTGIDFNHKESMYTQTKDALKKFAGQQIQKESTEIDDLKVEPIFTASQLSNPSSALEESLASFGFHRKKKGAFNPNQKRNQTHQKRPEKPVNPKNDKGEYLTCSSCGSFRHMLQQCPHSYENMAKGKGAVCSEVELFSSIEELRPDLLCLLAFEAVNKGILDSGCSATVAGEEWMESFLDTLSSDDRRSVVFGESSKWFKFGGGELLQSIKTVEFLCFLQGAADDQHGEK